MRPFVSVIAAVIAVPALAHDHGTGSWMNHLRLTDPVSQAWCCNEHDCAEVEVGGVRERADGFLVVETGEVIPLARVIWRSPDGGWWRCRYLQGEEAGKTRCLIGPPRGS